MTRARRRAGAAAVVAIAITFAAGAGGCVLYAPTAAQSPHGLQDLRYGTANKGLLAPGTARETVLLRLGVPDRVVDGGRVLLYVDSVESGSLLLLMAAPAGQIAGASLPLGSSVALAVVFDGVGRCVGHRLALAGYSEPHIAAQKALQAAQAQL
jgi:hypothetical protein